jgi:hypothetical protein
MKNMLTVLALLLLISGTALAGSEYNRCIKEENALKAQKAVQCSGFRYLLNPSACFATQKALKEYASGKCKKIDSVENADFSTQKVIQENKIISDADTKQMKVEIEVPRQEATYEQLQEENERLKAEVGRLKAENAQLRKAGR